MEQVLVKRLKYFLEFVFPMTFHLYTPPNQVSKAVVRRNVSTIVMLKSLILQRQQWKRLENWERKKIQASSASTNLNNLTISLKLRPCLVFHPKNFHSSHQIFGHMHGTLNVDKK